MKPMITILTIAAFAARTAAADPDAAQAEALYREAKELKAAGKLAEACATFEASQRRAPTPQTLLSVAICREMNGQLATAWGAFLEVERQTRGASGEASQILHETALERAAALERRISKLTISVPADSRVDLLAIAQNGNPVDEATWNRALPVDGGSYTITARAPGSAEWSATITVGGDGDTKTIEVPKLRTVTRPPPTGAADATPRSNRLALALAGGALAGLAIAVGFEYAARSSYNRAERTPDPSERGALWGEANTRRYAAEALAVAGLGCAGVAVWLYVRKPSGDGGHTSGIAFQPVLDHDHVGIGVMGRY